MRIVEGVAVTVMLACAAGLGAHSTAREDNARTALAERLLARSGAAIEPGAYARQLAQSARTMIEACRPDISAREAEAFEAAYLAELSIAVPRFADHISASYAERLSEDEILALLDFYGTDDGRAVAEAMPEITADHVSAQTLIERAMLRSYRSMGWCAPEAERREPGASDQAL